MIARFLRWLLSAERCWDCGALKRPKLCVTSDHKKYHYVCAGCAWRWRA